MTKPFIKRYNTSAVFLRFMKGGKEGLNPTIQGNTKPFIGSITINTEIQIDSVNFEQVYLIGSQNNKVDVSVSIQNALIHLDRTEFLKLTKHSGGVFISFRNCLLQSMYYIDEQTKEMNIGEDIILGIHRIGDKKPKNRIEIIHSKIHGGRFWITNIQIFRMERCLIQNNFPKISKDYDFQVLVKYASNQIDAINLNKMAHPSAKYISPNHNINIKLHNEVIKLDGVEDFHIKQCSVAHVLIKYFLNAKRSTGIIEDINFNASYMPRVMHSYSSKIHILNMKLENIIFIFKRKSLIHFNTVKSEVNITNLEISNVESSKNAFFSLSASNKLSMYNCFIQDTVFQNKMFLTRNSQLMISGMEIQRSRFQDSFIYSSEATVSIQDLRMIESSQWSSEKLSVFKLFRTKIELDRVHFNNLNTTTKHIFHSDNCQSDMNNINFINTKVPKTTIFLDESGKLTISNLKIHNSSSSPIFKLERKSSLTMSDIQIANTRLELHFLQANGGEAIIKRLTTKDSQFLGLMNLLGKKDSQVKLIATYLQIENTSIINHGFFSKYGNITIQDLIFVKSKLGNIIHATQSLLHLENATFHQIKVMNVQFISKASFNAFVFTEDSKAYMKRLQMVESTIEENVFKVDRSFVLLQRSLLANNSFSAGFELLYSELYLNNLESVSNEAFGRIKFINSEAFSTLHLKDISVVTPALLYFEKVIGLMNTELYISNVHIYIQSSSSLKFEIFKWEFETLMLSNLTNLIIQCPKNFNAMLTKERKNQSLAISCQKCKDDKYPSVSAERRLNITTRINRDTGFILKDLQDTVVKCQKCPTGAICTDGSIRARDNFHGFVNKSNEYEFVLCPDQYCCNSGTLPCTSPNSCSFNRTGFLCGQCQNNHFVNLEKKCIHNSKCSHRSLFWTFFLSIPISLSFIMTFANDIKYLLIRVIIFFKGCRRRYCACRKNEVERREPGTQRETTNVNKEISVSATLNIIMTFYQLKALVVVKNHNNNNNNLFVDQIFNIEWIAKGRKEFEYICPFESVNVLVQESMIGFMNPLVMVLTVLISLLLCRLLTCLKCSSRDKNLFTGRFYVGYYIVLAFSYKNICHTAFSFLNCKTINDKQYLYIDGSIECYQFWQIAAFIFLVIWVFPFPLSVGLSYKRLKNGEISRLRFLMYLSFPFIAILVICIKRFLKTNHETRQTYQRADNRLVEIFQLPYKEKYFWWEAWRLMERFIIAGLSVFLTNPIYRILYITLAFAIFSHVHRRMDPYKRSIFLLKRLDAVTWVCLFVMSLLNMMRAIAYIYDIHVDSITYALKAANILEQIFSPLWYFIISFVLRSVFG